MISVILLEKISKLGNIGQEVKVKDGFARNYLIPNKKAIRDSEENKKIFELKKEELVKINDEKIKIATEKLKKLGTFGLESFDLQIPVPSGVTMIL